MRYSSCFLLLLAFALTSPGANAQSAAQVANPVLYRLFFRDIAALENAAGKFDAAHKADADFLRNKYQGALFLTASQTGHLKADAAMCNSILDKQHTDAMPVILAARAKAMARPSGSAPLFDPSVVALDQARDEISNGCIQSLRSDLGTQTFQKIDIFLRTKFAAQVSSAAPSGAPFANRPVTQMGATK